MKFSESNYSKNSMRGVGSNLKTPPESKVLSKKEASKYGLTFSFGPNGPRKLPVDVTVYKGGEEVGVFSVSAQALRGTKRSVTYKLFITDVPFGTTRIKQINLGDVEVNL